MWVAACGRSTFRNIASWPLSLLVVMDFAWVDNRDRQSMVHRFDGHIAPRMEGAVATEVALRSALAPLRKRCSPPHDEGWGRMSCCLWWRNDQNKARETQPECAVVGTIARRLLPAAERDRRGRPAPVESARHRCARAHGARASGDAGRSVCLAGAGAARPRQA